jgi:hypothetical protein
MGRSERELCVWHSVSSWNDQLLGVGHPEIHYLTDGMPLGWWSDLRYDARGRQQKQGSKLMDVLAQGFLL